MVLQWLRSSIATPSNFRHSEFVKPGDPHQKHPLMVTLKTGPIPLGSLWPRRGFITVLTCSLQVARPCLSQKPSVVRQWLGTEPKLPRGSGAAFDLAAVPPARVGPTLGEPCPVFDASKVSRTSFPSCCLVWSVGADSRAHRMPSPRRESLGASADMRQRSAEHAVMAIGEL